MANVKIALLLALVCSGCANGNYVDACEDYRGTPDFWACRADQRQNQAIQTGANLNMMSLGLSMMAR